MIVADAMIFVYALIDVPGRSEEVSRALGRDAVVATPPLWRSELRNALLKYVRTASSGVSSGNLTLSDAVSKMREAELMVGRRTMDVKTRDVMQIADGSGVSAYDAEYVALAQDLGVRLLTTDGPVLNAFPNVAVHPRDFAA